MIYDILTISSIAYLIYVSFQKGMIFENWLLFWAKRILRKNEVVMTDMQDEDILGTAKSFNQIMKPLGMCVKCFAVWACLIIVLPYSLFVDYSFLDLSKIYLISIVITIWIAAKT